jgi:hypothetical protein
MPIKKSSAPPPPYQINIRESAECWKSEHNLSYSSLKMRDVNMVVKKGQIKKIQLKHPFTFSKV